MKRARTPSEHVKRRVRDPRRESVPVIMPFLRRSKTLLARRAGLGRLPQLIPEEGKVRGRRVALVDPGIGAPSAVLTLEESFHRGYRDFLFIGSCGGIARDLRIGHVILPETAISEEGTSRIYGYQGDELAADTAIVEIVADAAAENGLDIRKGKIWTTDAPYCETPAKIRHFRRLGAIGVEMETSALFAVSRLRSARIAGLLIVSDLLHEEWITGWDSEVFKAAEDRVLKVIIEAASRLGERKRTKRRSGGTS